MNNSQILTLFYIVRYEAKVKHNSVITPHISVQVTSPSLVIINGAITVITPPDKSGWRNNCLIENTGSVLVKFEGSDNLRSNKPLAATPVELPNSVIDLSNPSSLKINLEKRKIPKRFHHKPVMERIMIGSQLLISKGRFKPAIAIIIKRSADKIPISR